MIDRAAAARAIEDFLRALGREPVGEFAATPTSVADAWADDLLEGESVDAAAVLRDGSMQSDDPRGSSLVVVRDLSVSTMCPHHLLPAHGTALVAYAPGDRLAGIGTIARVVDVLSRRLTLQEQIGNEVVRLVSSELGAEGALCRIALTHGCLVGRGERKAGSIVETLAVAGTFASPGPQLDLALALLRGARG